MKKNLLYVIFVLIFIGGCSSASPKLVSEPIRYGKIKFEIVDINDIPIKNAKLEIEKKISYDFATGYTSPLKKNKEILKNETENIILENNIFELDYPIYSTSKYGDGFAGWGLYSFYVEYNILKIEKDNYYSKINIPIFSNFSIDYNDKIILYKNEDYFKKEFLNEERNIQLKEKISKFVDIMNVVGYLKNGNLLYRGIGLYNFRNKNYIEVNFNSSVIYNSSKFNKYDIGKEVYQELVVKILDYLVMIEDEKVNGVNVKVKGAMKNFINENDLKTEIQYDFIMEKETIRKFKDKDITSQKLLDESVILMDNERIELRLQ